MSCESVPLPSLASTRDDPNNLNSAKPGRNALTHSEAIKAEVPAYPGLGTPPAIRIVPVLLSMILSVWTAFTTADNYQTLLTNLLAGNSANFDLRFTAPTSTSSYTEKTLTVTLQAVAP